MLQADRGQYYGLTDYEIIAPYINYCIEYETRVTLEISILESRRFHADLFGLLRIKNIEPLLWPIIMIINGYNSPGEYSGESKLIGVAGSVTRSAFTRSYRNVVSLG